MCLQLALLDPKIYDQQVIAAARSPGEHDGNGSIDRGALRIAALDLLDGHRHAPPDFGRDRLLHPNFDARVALAAGLLGRPHLGVGRLIFGEEHGWLLGVLSAAASSVEVGGVVGRPGAGGRSIFRWRLEGKLQASWNGHSS